MRGSVFGVRDEGFGIRGTRPLTEVGTQARDSEFGIRDSGEEPRVRSSAFEAEVKTLGFGIRNGDYGIKAPGKSGSEAQVTPSAGPDPESPAPDPLSLPPAP